MVVTLRWWVIPDGPAKAEKTQVTSDLQQPRRGCDPYASLRGGRVRFWGVGPAGLAGGERGGFRAGCRAGCRAGYCGGPLGRRAGRGGGGGRRPGRPAVLGLVR